MTTSPSDADFEEFVRARSGALLATALLLTGDAQLAEDLLQTALVKAWRTWGRVHSSHEGFVRRILVNTYLSWWRRRWNGEHPTGELPERAADASDRDAVLDLRRAVHLLPKRQRAVVVLRYFDDLPDDEIAAILGCAPATVRSQAHRALTRLAHDLQDGDPR